MFEFTRKTSLGKIKRTQMVIYPTLCPYFPYRNECKKPSEKDSHKIRNNVIKLLAIWLTSNLSFLCSVANLVQTERPQKLRGVNKWDVWQGNRQTHVNLKGIAEKLYIYRRRILSRTLQYRIRYWVFLESTTVWPQKSYKIFWWCFPYDLQDLCYTYSWIWVPGNLRAHPETESTLTLQMKKRIGTCFPYCKFYHSLMHR